MIWDPIIPIPWIALTAVLALGTGLWAAVRANRRLGLRRATTLTVLRMLAISGILLLLLQPSRRESFQPPVRERSILVALDISSSMQTADAGGATRIDAAKELVRTEILEHVGETPVILHIFSRSPRQVGLKDFATATATGPETLIHTSIERIVAISRNPAPAALFLFSDGHDFEGEPPARTARSARARDLPIFAVPIGTPVTAPDVSIRIASYHPYTFIGQNSRIAATVRVHGFPEQRLVIDLLREGKRVDSKTVETGRSTYLDTYFSVSEEEAGQFEYSLHLRPMRGETETSNNTAVTFLNVVDDKLRVLEIEGRPYWDSTFLRRSLTRNDKFEIDSLIAFAEGRVRAIRSDPEMLGEALTPPTIADDFQGYHLVLIGKEAERVLGNQGIAALETWVKEQEGIVVFTRGQGWTPDISRDLEPIAWGDTPRSGVSLDLTATQNFPPLRILQAARRRDSELSFDALPGISKPKTLASVFGHTLDDEPAIVYRRYGKGQALSLGIANAWRWVFNERTDFDNNAFDLFWDQTALWLLANQGLSPLTGFSFTANSANIPVGEDVIFSLNAAGVDLPAVPPSITISQEGRPLSKLTMAQGKAGLSLSASFTPEQAGRYTASMRMPDGSEETIRFISYMENLETVETAVDTAYLGALARASGGGLLKPGDITKTVKQLLLETGRQQAIERIRPIWPTLQVFLVLILFLSLDWYYRRKWGLS